MAKRKLQKHPRPHTERAGDQGLNRNIVGYSLIVLAVAAALVNTADTIRDLKDWHQASDPSFVGPFLKQVGTTVIAAIGGKLLPT